MHGASKTYTMSSTEENLEKKIDDPNALEVAGTAEEQIKPVSRFMRWYRSPLSNVILVGLISFTQPGIWNALNSTGAGGQQEPYLVNGSNALTFG